MLGSGFYRSHLLLLQTFSLASEWNGTRLRTVCSFFVWAPVVRVGGGRLEHRHTRGGVLLRDIGDSLILTWGDTCQPFQKHPRDSPEYLNSSLSWIGPLIMSEISQISYESWKKQLSKSSWKAKIIGQRNNSTRSHKSLPYTYTYDLKFKTLMSHMCLCLWSLGLLAVLKPVCVSKRKRGCDPPPATKRTTAKKEMCQHHNQ